jgi:ethanolamine transporter EutH
MIDYATLSLDQQHAAFVRHKFLAMPIAGTIAWTAIGIAGALLPLGAAAWALFIGTGMIFSLGVVVARFTGEDLLGRESKGNYFDNLFFHTIAMAVLVYSIAIPFFLVERTSLPMSVGILSGLMWIPFSSLIGHWVGLFHGIARTVLLVFAHYAFPNQRFVIIPAIIVLIYLSTIVVLHRRYAAVMAAPAPYAVPEGTVG